MSYFLAIKNQSPYSKEKVACTSNLINIKPKLQFYEKKITNFRQTSIPSGWMVNDGLNDA